MSKITLQDLTSIQNDPTAVDTINDNSAAIVSAFNNTLSRDGSSPNQMLADLDMNSKKILNLPAPRSPNEPARWKDVGDAPSYAASAAASAAAAAVSETDANTSAVNSAASESAAAASASASSTSATNSNNSAIASASSATAASGSATSAGTSATNSANSASASSTSAGNASTSATNAGNSATAAAGSASAASTSATNAANSATAAAGSATSAAASLSNFQSEYLGPLASNPVGSYSSGTLYWNTTTSALMVFDGTNWVSYNPSVGGVTSVFGRSGTVAAQTGDYNFNQLSGNITTTQMDSGTGASPSTFFRGDGTWASPGGGVTSWNARTGVVIPAANDYTFAQLASKPTTISGYGITDALVKTNNLSDVSSVSTARTNLGLGTMAVQTQTSGSGVQKGNGTGGLTAATAGTDFMSPSVTSTITVGYTFTANNIGTITTGTVTPNPALANYQYYTNNGAHTLAAPSSDCAIDIFITNGASAGVITFSGFTRAIGNTGDLLTTTNTSKFVLSIRRVNAIATYTIKALQ